MDPVRVTDCNRASSSGDSTDDAESLATEEAYQDYWNRMAGTKEGAYLAVAGLPFGKPPTEESLDRHGEPSARVIADKLGIAKEHQVLEVGVGVGRLAKHIAARCAKFTGIDISHKMIAITSERLRQLPNVTLIAHEKSDLSIFQNNSFDRAYFQTVLIHLDREDVFNYLRETYRVLRPGGLAWFHFYNLLHPKGFAEFRYAADYAVQHGGKLRGRVQCVTAPEVRRLVKEAGLQIRDDLSHLELERQNFGFEIPDSDWEYYLIAIAEKQQEG